MGIARGHSFDDNGAIVGGQPLNDGGSLASAIQVGNQGVPQIGFGVGTQPAMTLPEVPAPLLTDPKSGLQFDPKEYPGMALNQPDSIAYRAKVLGENLQTTPETKNEYNRVWKQQRTWHENIDAEQRDPAFNPNANQYIQKQDALRKRILADPDAALSGHSKNYTDMDIFLAQRQGHQIDAGKKAVTLGSSSPERKEQVKAIGKALEQGFRGK